MTSDLIDREAFEKYKLATIAENGLLMRKHDAHHDMNKRIAKAACNLRKIAQRAAGSCGKNIHSRGWVSVNHADWIATPYVFLSAGSWDRKIEYQINIIYSNAAREQAREFGRMWAQIRSVKRK
jgi:hypothetical protein